jgi:hypothetical protein
MTTLDKQRIITIVFEVIAMCAGFYRWKKNKGTVLNVFTVYLAVIVLCETTSNRLLYYKYNMTVNYLATFFTIPLEFFFFFYFFSKLIKTKAAAKYGILITVIGLTIFMFEEFILKTHKKYFFMSLFYSVSNVFLLIFVIWFFLKFLKSENLLDYKRNPAFWISTGVLLFYLGTFPLFAMFNSLLEWNKRLFLNYYTVQFWLNWMMYSCFAIAFIWGKPKYILS